MAELKKNDGKNKGIRYALTLAQQRAFLNYTANSPVYAHWLKRLFMRIYEDNTAGRLSDERYEMFSASYEAEQKQLEAEADRIRKEIEVQEKQTESVEQFIARLKDHSLEIDTLDGYILHELIEAIYVEAPDKSSGHRMQRIHIKYNGTGFIPINELMAKQTA